jgi:A/G-specific adenine glycosylase
MNTSLINSGQTNVAARLLDWYDDNGRTDLPWRQEINPYRIWVSEIMLQQTQVSTVIPYFQRFIARFPNIDILAEAELDDVLHLWTGLGYYARGRNLHKAATIIATDLAGIFPEQSATLQKLPGIGRSTAGAICSIAFNQSTPILDGNVKRVLARYYAIEGWPGQSRTQKILWEKAEQNTPGYRCAAYTQAIMDLGATLCTPKKPQCPSCPLNLDCTAHKAGTEQHYPASKRRKVLPVRQTYFLIASNPDGDILLEQRPPTGLWGGLWCFPQSDTLQGIHSECERLGLPPGKFTQGQQLQHTFSHYRLDYTPLYLSVGLSPSISDNKNQWVKVNAPGKIGLPRPVEKLLEAVSLT